MYLVWLIPLQFMFLAMETLASTVVSLLKAVVSCPLQNGLPHEPEAIPPIVFLHSKKMHPFGVHSFTVFVF